MSALNVSIGIPRVPSSRDELWPRYRVSGNIGSIGKSPRHSPGGCRRLAYQRKF
jgi:hypothetical protein